MSHGGIGIVEEGKLKGRKFIVPTHVLVEKGTMGGQETYHLACLVHGDFIPNEGCPECEKE